MSTTEPSIFVLLITAGFGSVVGYLLRNVKKIEDRKDEIYLNILPELFYNTYSFVNSIENFLLSNQLSPFKENIKDVNNNLVKQAFSGNLLVFEPDIHKLLSDFYVNSKNFQSILEQIDDNEENTKLVKLTIESGKDFMGMNPKNLLKNAEDINNKIESKIKKYKSFSYYLIILLFALGVAAAIIEYQMG